MYPRRRVRGKPDAQIEEAVFGTFTADLEDLSDWLRKHRVRQVAMESTGVYRMPVWNVLESAGRFELLLVNPATVRALQGHKTDRVDAAHCRVSAVWTAARQLYTSQTDPSAEGTDAHACPCAARPQPRYQPHRKSAGNREHQAGGGGHAECVIRCCLVVVVRPRGSTGKSTP